MDIGLLLLRVLLAAILFAHGTQKALGWFSGPGPAGAEALFGKLGQVPARTKVRLAVVCELAAATLLLLGLVTPLGAAIAAGTMLVAGFSMIYLNNTFWNSAGGGEYPIVLSGTALVLGFTGPGRYSLDALIDSLPWGVNGEQQVLIGLVVVVVAVVAAYPPLRTVRQARASRADVG
ncbi:DoxX family protein [Rhodococcus sp. ACS1]|uniref:DoxX family protein n=1 Tax=Rhodococcus sp. ACS1 TaxID=2028570 RepID=UPI000BB12B8B|nr:DoxX family protein [Rhodococcus sp. ACS1]PBC36800.1 DoxX family protein [Rhodococcus sp. ACS1]